MRGNSVSLPSKEPQNDRLGPVKDSPHKLTHGSLCYLCFMLIFLALVSALAISDKFLIFQDCLQWSSIPWDGFFFISLLSKLYNSNHLSLSTHLLVFAFLPLCWTWGRNPPGLLSPLPVHCPKLSPTALSILSVRSRGPVCSDGSGPTCTSPICQQSSPSISWTWWRKFSSEELTSLGVLLRVVSWKCSYIEEE